MTDLSSIAAGVAGLVEGQKAVLQRLDRIEKFMDEKAVTQSEHDDLERRIKRAEGVIGWAGKSIVGIFVTALAAVVGMKGMRPLLIAAVLMAPIGSVA